MWNALNVLIGTATVMLVLSLVVTALTQALSDALDLRAGHLREGVIGMLGASGIDPRAAAARFDGSALSGRTHVTAEEVAALGGGAETGAACGFGPAMARISDEFTASSRLLAASMAILVAFGLPLDTLDLMRVFSADHAQVLFPHTIAEWLARWQQVNVAGVMISATLLTLGAPLWFELLKDLLKLRGRQSV